MGGGVELWNCSVQLLIAASLCWTAAVYWRHTHQCALSCSETFLSDCWLQPACIEGLLCTWDVEPHQRAHSCSETVLSSVTTVLLVKTRPASPLPTLCGDLKLPSSAQCSHLFLAQFQIPGRLISMAELGQILTLRWKRDYSHLGLGVGGCGDRCFSYGWGPCLIQPVLL